MKRAHRASLNSEQAELIRSCAHCGASLEGTHKARKYCSQKCKVAYRQVSAGNYPPPEYVGDYARLPDHIKACFTPGDPEDCWIYSKRSPNGYALNTTVRMYKANAYRLIYLMMVGPIPEGLDLDHTCDNGRGGCVNWHHLTPTTHRRNMTRPENTLAGKQVSLTHCPKGHPYSGDNLILTKRKDGVDRECKTCKYARVKAWVENNKERVAEQKRRYQQSPEGKATRRAAAARRREAANG